MSNGVREAIEKYVRAVGERDPAVREKLLEECYAVDGRFVTRSRELRGRAALAQEMARVLADPELLRVRLTSVIDTGVTTFRFRGVVDRRSGTSAESFDTGEVDAEGRIRLLITFSGPLADAPSAG